jgi:hypothetical protein
MANQKLKSQRCYSAAFFLRFARARRSVFFRRLARFLALSLPLLFPIIPNTLPLTSNIKKFFGDLRPLVAPSRLPCRSLTKAGHAVISTKAAGPTALAG